MAQENDELNKRRKQREEYRKKRKAQQRRMKIRLIAAVIVSLATMGVIHLLV